MKNLFNQIRDANSNMSRTTKIIYGCILVVLLIGMLDKVLRNPWVILQIAVLIISVSFHEVAHGYVANKFGDPTARLAGRLTLNPIKHIDPLGLLVPLILIFTGSSFVIGWAKPVPISYRIFRKNKLGYFSVSIAGIMTNLFLVFIAATLIKFIKIDSQIYYYIVTYMLRINLVLAIFNLVPIPPLDGSKILESFLGNKGVQFLESMERYGFLVIMILLWTGILQQFLSPFYGMFIKIIDFYIKL